MNIHTITNIPEVSATDPYIALLLTFNFYAPLLKPLVRRLSHHLSHIGADEGSICKAGHSAHETAFSNPGWTKGYCSPGNSDFSFYGVGFSRFQQKLYWAWVLSGRLLLLPVGICHRLRI